MAIQNRWSFFNIDVILFIWGIVIETRVKYTVLMDSRNVSQILFYENIFLK